MSGIHHAGPMQGVVVDVDDPEKRGRVKIKIPDLFFDPTTGQTIPSPWVEAKGAMGQGLGMFVVPPVGAPVWVQSRYSSDEDVYQLVYEPGRHGADALGAHIPLVAQGKDDETSGGLKAGAPFKVPSAASKAGTIEHIELEGLPPSANAGTYPNNKVLKLPGGVTLEADDTEGARRFHLWHPSGTYIEVGEKGGKVERSAKEWREVADSSTTYIGTDDRRRVNGHVLESVGGQAVEEVGGDKIVTARSLSLEGRVQLMIDAGEYIFRAGGKPRERYLAGRVASIVGDNTCSWLGQGNFFSMGTTTLAAPTAAVNVIAMQMNLMTTALLPVRVGPAAGIAAATPVALATPLLALLNTLGAFTTDPAGWGAAVNGAAALLAAKSLESV